MEVRPFPDSCKDVNIWRVIYWKNLIYYGQLGAHVLEEEKVLILFAGSTGFGTPFYNLVVRIQLIARIIMS